MAVDSARLRFGEAGSSTATEAKQCAAADGGSSKTCFSRHKNSRLVDMWAIFKILSLLYLAVRELLSVRQSFYLTDHGSRWCSAASVSLLVFLCDFGVRVSLDSLEVVHMARFLPPGKRKVGRWVLLLCLFGPRSRGEAVEILSAELIVFQKLFISV